MHQRHTIRLDSRLLALLLILALLAIMPLTPFAPPVARAANLCGAWDTDWSSSSAYYVQNNVWGASTSQCVNTTSSTNWTVTSSHNNATNGAPASYPSVIKGCHSRDLNPQQNQLCTNGWTHYATTNIGTATASWSIGVPNSGNWNAAMDIWYGPQPGTYSGTEIMIWINHLGSIQPIGGKVASSFPLAGASWDVWTGTTSGGNPSVNWKVISYVRTAKVTSVTNLNLKDFQDDAISRQQLTSGHYLTGIDAGFEIWSGTGFSTSSFSAAVAPPATDTTAPTVPGGLSSPSKTTSSVNLSWNASTDAVGVTGYDIYVNNVLNKTVTSNTNQSVTGLAANTAYSFTVKARDAAGNVSAPSSALSVTTNAATTDTQAPTVPGGLSSPSKTSSSVNLSWNASTDNTAVTGYDIYVNNVLNKTVTSNTNQSVTGLNANTAYSFTVKAKDAAGNMSAASSALSVTTNAATTSTLKVQYKDGGGNQPGNSEIKPFFQIANTGSSSVSLTGYKLRYYFTRDTAQSLSMACDWAAMGCGNLSGSFVAISPALTGADYYLEISFSGGSVAANGNTGEMQLRLYKADYSNFNETGDYSFDATKTNLADWSKAVLLNGTTVVWGTPPS